ncbi:wax ester/triacylglycerol synthase family O-acyltransferase [uncultured Jatrophihabitans sp.]|uniref:WS/DGAT/MGAT family O-acyltransferase n=1 Tax=uncultured Jatrophihabitans sp. TaxID=1610747 RepID=UPI0035CBF59B
MLLPMSPANSMFLLAETRDYPMHVGSLQLYTPPDGANALDVRALLEQAIADDLARPETAAAPVFTKRPRRSLTTLGQWGWENDKDFDLEHHVRRSALPQPGRVLELLALVSRLHSTLLDRRRPLWEMHLIEGLQDGRYAIYSKVHHSMMDGVSALRMLGRMLSPDARERGMPPPWAPRPPAKRESGGHESRSPAQQLLSAAGDAVGMGPALGRSLVRALGDRGGSLAFSAPNSMFNVPITGARRFAAQSWPIERIRAVSKAADGTVNDVVLAMCSGALRDYLLSLDALPETSLIAMVPVSLHGEGSASGDGGGNAVGAVMCNLGTDKADAGERLETVHRSMDEGKSALRSMTPLQILMMSALAMSPLAVWPALGLVGTMRPPFNVIISNVPGPQRPMFWNGAQLESVYPLSIPLDGQALNITCVSYSDAIGFGLTGCRRSVPHLQRMLGFLDEELNALEKAVGV